MVKTIPINGNDSTSDHEFSRGRASNSDDKGILNPISIRGASQVALVVKNLPASEGDVRDVGSTLGLGRSPGEGIGNPLQYSCLGSCMDRGAWRATVHGVTKSRIWLNTHTHMVKNTSWRGSLPGFIFIYYYFWPSSEACGILIPQPGMEPAPPAMEAPALTTGQPGKSPAWFQIPATSQRGDLGQVTPCMSAC